MQTLSTLERRREESKAGEPQVLLGVDRGEKQEESGFARKRASKKRQQERRRETRPGAPRWCKFSYQTPSSVPDLEGRCPPGERAAVPHIAVEDCKNTSQIRGGQWPANLPKPESCANSARNVVITAGCWLREVVGGRLTLWGQEVLSTRPSRYSQVHLSCTNSRLPPANETGPKRKYEKTSEKKEFEFWGNRGRSTA
ncbi:hypothetical protein J7T55_007506 [Diaporthe amygdali]|uniref:uncharacterized protein n=1 Tax=Phomopsis amygdali TaxID=1214568 RepID=UPI0022FE0249|nr:uncharacterized protein J7T55_007506 [Diaporthe amygdali]KAJ0116526.1 hypothetical protein J7T55_007506 [Diaporthe amygdali]